MEKYVIDEITTEMCIQMARANLFQLLRIGIVNSDENIKDVYGGEEGLANLCYKYFNLMDDLTLYRNREEQNGKRKI